MSIELLLLTLDKRPNNYRRRKPFPDHIAIICRSEQLKGPEESDFSCMKEAVKKLEIKL
jgi:hypothetical protein